MYKRRIHVILSQECKVDLILEIMNVIHHMNELKVHVCIQVEKHLVKFKMVLW